jgi:hypothetical protein
MADTDIPKFKNYAEGEPIPPVDPEAAVFELVKMPTPSRQLGIADLQSERTEQVPPRTSRPKAAIGYHGASRQQVRVSRSKNRHSQPS